MINCLCFPTAFLRSSWKICWGGLGGVRPKQVQCLLAWCPTRQAKKMTDQRELSDMGDIRNAAPESTCESISDIYLGELTSVLGVSNMPWRDAVGGVTIGLRPNSFQAAKSLSSRPLSWVATTDTDTNSRPDRFSGLANWTTCVPLNLH